MSPTRILGLAIAASTLASSVVLSATGIPEHVCGTIAATTVNSVTVDTCALKPITVALMGKTTYLTLRKSNLNQVKTGSFIGTTTNDVVDARVVQRALLSSEAPARIANIWGGFDHQPTESEVQRAEQARGVAPDAEQQRRDAQILRQLDRALLKNAGAAAGQH
jgi:hypothetical protein